MFEFPEFSMQSSPALAEAARANRSTSARFPDKDFWVPTLPKKLEQLIDLGEEMGVIRPSMSVLELGSGNGTASHIWHERGYHVTGVELDTDLVEEAKQFPGIRFIHGSYFTAEYLGQYEAGNTKANEIEASLRAKGEWDEEQAATTFFPVARHTRIDMKDFDLIYAYLWRVQVPTAVELFTRYAKPNAILCLGECYHLRDVKAHLKVQNAFTYHSEREDCNFLVKIRQRTS